MSTKMMATMTLIMSTIMVMSSENWFSMWMGLEINMISFIPLMEEKKNYNSPQAKMTYFLIQSLGSILFIFTIITTPIMIINEKSMTSTMMIIITMSMMMKMGMAPMHMWFVNIMAKMSWSSCMMIMTWQKIAPMWIMTNFNQNSMVINMCATTSALMGAIGGLNQTSIKKIMAFSSVNHLGWMLMCLKYNNEMWMKYLMIYSVMIIMLTKMFDKNSINFINQMNMNLKTSMSKINIIIMMMSLGGLPPFLGFLPKWIVISTLMNEGSMTILMILLFSSMVTLFYYMRMSAPIMMSWKTMNKWNLNWIEMKTQNLIMLMMNLSLPMASMLSLI
uniref:NADH-ubiquinone oxidoreductase chain 2 n=1 Tax=Limnogonus intermedius TaxID=913169 RepID=A0A5B9XW23_9HEMI|nr:NADH dehydrogenase subunit 2 [Limnogonus intermedius]QEH58916.1 NADH dehydrogenase subunit 2 [Limnogonus intermedius]